MRYLVRARVRLGSERSVLQAIEQRTLGKGSDTGSKCKDMLIAPLRGPFS